jgi:hypothetical protein
MSCSPRRKGFFAKTDALMALFERLEASLAGTATRSPLLDALLDEALAKVEAGQMEAAE